MPVADIMPAVKLILAKQPEISRLWDYYEGAHILKFSTEKLQKIFGTIGVFFSENWMEVIIDSVTDRMVLEGFKVTSNEQATQVIKELFSTYKLGLISDDVHQATVVTSEAYMIVGKVDGVLEAYFNEPDMCEVIYEASNPMKKKYAAKMWLEGNYLKVNLYYPNKTEYYQSQYRKSSRENTKLTSLPLTSLKWEKLKTTENPHGIIPVFHFRTSLQGRGKLELGISERSIQDAINILGSNVLAGAEISTLKQRVIISQSDPGDLVNQAGLNWWIPAGDGESQQASVTELGAFDPTPVMNAMDRFASAIAAMSRTPKHYFFSSEGQAPSGEALTVMESPLVKKTKRYIKNLDVTWIEVIHFMALLMGQNIRQDEIISQWSSPETVQPLTQASTVKTNVEAGMPLETALRENGWSQEKLTQLEADQKKVDKRMTGLAQEELEKLRREDAQNNDNGSRDTEQE